MKISVVIPCYGSENTIEAVVDEIENTIHQRKIEHEIILVNDCSPDQVWKRISKGNQLCQKLRTAFSADGRVPEIYRGYCNLHG